MIKFESLQESLDVGDMVTYILETQYDDFIEFIIDHGCAGLTEEELTNFEELDTFIHGEGGMDDQSILEEFAALVNKAALDLDTRHVYALAARTQLSLDSIENAQANEENQAKV